MSNKSKTARKMNFDQSTTVIKGTNDTGKSCSMKSLYYALGAETRQHPMWLDDRVICLLKFRIDNVDYSILRSESYFSLFDSNNVLIGTYNSVTNDLAPVLSEIFDYKIKLLDRKGNVITPPPAYIYLPFYIDQDLSWSSNWNSFKNLKQLSDWKKPIVEYLTGIKPNKYYDNKTEIDKLKIKKRDMAFEIKIQNNVYNKISQIKNEIIITYDISSFEKEINELLIQINKIQEKAEKYKNELAEEYNRLSYLKYQKQIIEESKKENHADYEFATNSISEENIECPTCGALYNNGFSERFSIAKDEDSCDSMLIEIIKEIYEVEKDIENKKQALSTDSANITELKKVLEIKKEQITLKDVIDNESRINARRTIKEEIIKSERLQIDIENEIQIKNAILKEIEDPERIREIKAFYIESMRKNLFSLDVNTLSEKDYKSIISKISEIGSDLPRALLAYYYAILETIYNKSTTTRFPIVIDSPNQNAQDEDSLKRMYKFIIEKKPIGSQLILGTEELGDLEYPGKVIELNNKYHLLQKEYYDEVYNEMSYYIKESFQLK